MRNPFGYSTKEAKEWDTFVDYRELKNATVKDLFLTPYVEQILQNISGRKIFSFMDGFSGYNKIKIAIEDRHKMTFTS